MNGRELTTSWLTGLGYGLIFAGVAYGAARFFPDERQELVRKVVHLLVLAAGAIVLFVCVRRRRPAGKS